MRIPVTIPQTSSASSPPSPSPSPPQWQAGDWAGQKRDQAGTAAGGWPGCGAVMNVQDTRASIRRTSSCYLYHVAKLFLPMHNYHFSLYCMYWSSMHKIRLKIFTICVSVKGPDKFQKYLLIEHWDMYVVTKFASIHCQVCIVRKMLIVCPPDLLKPKETTSLKRSSDTTDSLMDHLRTSNNNRQFNR